jgi:hypothetical protein
VDSPFLLSIIEGQDANQPWKRGEKASHFGDIRKRETGKFLFRCQHKKWQLDISATRLPAASPLYRLANPEGPDRCDLPATGKRMPLSLSCRARRTAR